MRNGIEGKNPSAYTTRIENIISELEEYLAWRGTPLFSYNLGV